MSTQYFCKKPQRRGQVLAARDSGGNPVLNGIDFLEVTAADQKTLTLTFLFNLPGQANGVSGARWVLLPGGHDSPAAGGRVLGRGLGDAASGVPATAQCR